MSTLQAMAFLVCINSTVVRVLDLFIATTNSHIISNGNGKVNGFLCHDMCDLCDNGISGNVPRRTWAPPHGPWSSSGYRLRRRWFCRGWHLSSFVQHSIFGFISFIIAVLPLYQLLACAWIFGGVFNICVTHFPGFTL